MGRRGNRFFLAGGGVGGCQGIKKRLASLQVGCPNNQSFNELIK